MTALEHRYVEVDGARAHYVEAGEGPPVVLVHGLGASLAVWQENILPLAQRFRVVAVDLPWHGDSASVSAGVRPEDGVAFLGRFLDAQGLPTISLAGNSAGGLLAALFALAHPERVERLALVAPAGLGRQVALALRLASLPLLGHVFDLPGLYTPGVVARAVLYDAKATDNAVVREVARLRSRPGTRDVVRRAVRASVRPWGLRGRYVVLRRLREYAHPLLVVWGREDRIIPAYHARLTAMVLPEAKVVVFPRCGHWPQLERADEFNALMLDFLTTAPAQRRQAV